MFDKMRPGTIILNVHLDFTPEAFKAYKTERFGYATFSALRTSASKLIREGALDIDEIRDGKAHVHCDETTLQMVVQRAVDYRKIRHAIA